MRALLLFPIKLAATLAFFYAVAGWLVIPPGALF